MSFHTKWRIAWSCTDVPVLLQFPTPVKKKNAEDFLLVIIYVFKPI